MLCKGQEVEEKDLESWEVRMGSRSIAMEFGMSFDVDGSMLMSNDIRRGTSSRFIAEDGKPVPMLDC